MITLAGAGSRVERVRGRRRCGPGAIHGNAGRRESGASGAAGAEEMDFFPVIKRLTVPLVGAVTGSAGPESTGFQVEGPARRGLASRNALC
jgi:hypothetical protein